MTRYLLDELGYETATPKEDWTPPEEWARSKVRSERGGDEAASGDSKFSQALKRDS